LEASKNRWNKGYQLVAEPWNGKTLDSQMGASQERGNVLCVLEALDQLMKLKGVQPLVEQAVIVNLAGE